MSGSERVNARRHEAGTQIRNFSPRRKEDTEEEWKAANGEQKRDFAQRRYIVSP